MTSLQINGLLMDEADADSDSIVWCWGEIEGWWGAPDTDTNLAQQVAGQAVTANRHRGRALTLSGIARHVSESVALGESLWQTAARKLNGAVNLVETPGLLLVNEATPTQAYVRRVGRVRERRLGALHWYGFEVPLLAEDPAKYAQTATTDLTLSISGAGTTDTATVTLPTAANGGMAVAPVITLDGPAVNPKITNSTDGGKYIRWVGTLGAGDTLVIDLAAGTVLLNGANDIDALDAASEFWTLLPGANSLVYDRTSGASASTAQLDYRVAYIA